MGIHIQLNNPNTSYFAGQVVDGEVVVHNAKQDEIKRVTIQLKGKGRVHWSEQESYPVTTTIIGPGNLPQTRVETRYRTVTISSKEKYVSLLSILARDGANSVTLPDGTAVFRFRFKLPSNLPSSFSSNIGQISYTLKGTVKKPTLFKSNDMAKLRFTVNGIFDLNLQPKVTLPLEFQLSKGSNFFACRNGKVNFVLRLPTRTGFVPGEAVDFTANITNGSNKKITGVKASLQQVTNFYAQGASKTKSRHVCDILGPEVDKGEHELWEGKLLIPAIPPTKLGGKCRIIDLQYFLYLEMKISGSSSSLTGKLPVMIGTIPLRVTFGNFGTGQQNMPGMGVPMHQAQQPMSSGRHPEVVFNNPNSALEAPIPSQNGEDAITTAPVFSDYPDLPPPSYTEAVGSEGLTSSPEGSNTDPNEKGSDNHGMKQEDGDDDIPNSAATASVPITDEFVPNYITYNMRN